MVMTLEPGIPLAYKIVTTSCIETARTQRGTAFPQQYQERHLFPQSGELSSLTTWRSTRSPTCAVGDSCRQ